MQTRIVITGHGHYASGAKSTIELIAGHQAGIAYWDFGIDWQYEDLSTAIKNHLNEFPEDEMLFLCDIIGGTPFKLAVEHTHQLERVVVVAGVNMSAMIEVILQRDILSLESLALLAVTETQGTVARFVQSANYRPESVLEGI